MEIVPWIGLLLIFPITLLVLGLRSKNRTAQKIKNAKKTQVILLWISGSLAGLFWKMLFEELGYDLAIYSSWFITLLFLIPIYMEMVAETKELEKRMPKCSHCLYQFSSS